jgi:CheY-like chemotaxis protein
MSTGEPRGGLQTLLVEDEQANRALVRAMLARSGDPRIRDAELIEASSLQAARALLAERNVDIVLLDVRLPDGSGLDLAAELSTRGDAERPRVIVMSASILPAEQAAASAAGCDAFLAKPFRSAELTGILALLATPRVP